MSVLGEMASAATPERALEMLDRTPYAPLLEEGLDMIRAGRLSAFDRRFELELLHRLRRAAQQQGMGLAILMRYAWLKYNEVLNLRMIARATEIHLAPDLVREEVVYPRGGIPLRSAHAGRIGCPHYRRAVPRELFRPFRGTVEGP